MDAIIAAFSDASRRSNELVNEISRRTSSKVVVDENMLRIVVRSKDLETVAKSPGIDRAALAYHADKDPQDIAKAVVRVLRELEDAYETVIPKYRLELYAEDERLFDYITREVFALSSYRASPESPYTVYVDVISAGAFVYSERVQGPGGLPIGVSGSAAAAISGSVDSFVAAYMAMRRGFRIVGLYPMLTIRAKSLLPRVERLAESIDETFVIKPIDLMDGYNELMDEITGVGMDDYAALALKLRIVRRLSIEARRLGIKNLVLGDVLMQSPTQTPKMMRAEDLVAAEQKVHLFRPILSFTNVEIFRRAEFLGLENAKDPIELPAERKIDDDSLKILIDIVQGLRASRLFPACPPRESRGTRAFRAPISRIRRP